MVMKTVWLLVTTFRQTTYIIHPPTPMTIVGGKTIRKVGKYYILRDYLEYLYKVVLN